MDRRFALLATVLAGAAGATTRDGQPYTAQQFLDALDPETPEPPAAAQTVAEMEAHVLTWIADSNAKHREDARR
jgi:hypothetical protein